MNVILSDALCAFAAPLRQININKKSGYNLALPEQFIQKSVRIVHKCVLAHAHKETHTRTHHRTIQTEKPTG